MDAPNQEKYCVVVRQGGYVIIDCPERAYNGDKSEEDLNVPCCLGLDNEREEQRHCEPRCEEVEADLGEMKYRFRS